MAFDEKILALLSRGVTSLEVMAAAAQLPALEMARATIKSEYDTAEESSEQEADALRRLDQIDQAIQRAERALGIPEAS